MRIPSPAILSSFIIILLLLLSSCAASSASVTVDMIHIPAGEFEMGFDSQEAMVICMEFYEPYGSANKPCKLNAFEDEEPVHWVTLDDFYIDKYEVTTSEYQVCVSEGVCKEPESDFEVEGYFDSPEYANYPIVSVGWDDAKTYCEWRGARLPTEAEWEKAARGTDGRTYPWGDEFNGNYGNFCDRDYEFNDGYEENAPVGSFSEGASPYGVMDMAGNAWEWVSDWYGYNYYTNSPGENPQGPAEGSMRVLKGGTWKCEGYYDVRAADRAGWYSDLRYIFTGFRCASSTAPE